ncbi:hypothetical protein BDK51DRAFT_8225, partial [Blyttiomyces helicus]
RGTAKDSFAFTTISTRLPVILTQAVDSLTRTAHAAAMNPAPDADAAAEAEKASEANECISAMSKLKYELQRDREFESIAGDEEGDEEAWRAAMDSLGDVAEGGKTWFSAPWLFAECFMYRKIRQILSKTKHWAEFDPFAEHQKQASFHGSAQSIIQLAQNLEDLVQVVDTLNAEQKRTALDDFIQFSLWGNQADLSLFVNVQHSEMHKSQISSPVSLVASSKNIIVNNIADLLDTVDNCKGGRIDIVLDNAGFELFADLALADWLTTTKSCANLHLHVKRIPWFVSDTTARDFTWTLDACAALGSEPLSACVARWRRWIADGTWVVREEAFWTTPYSFWQMSEVAPGLWADLGTSRLVIFKGDLNYRKMVYDAEWPTITPFRRAIGPLANARPFALALLRTCKSEVVVGIVPGHASELSTWHVDWMTNGKFGVVHL